jgi:pimeloyl-ACP methyl ester carboxylesterase
MKYIRIGLISLLSLLLVGALVAYFLFRSANVELTTLDDAARKSASGSFVQLSDGITHYELSGPDTGKVVILVHGFSVPYYIWDSNSSRLAQAGFRVLRYDQFGRGFSDRPDKNYDASLYRRQLSELLDKLQIHSVLAIAGVSFGGPVVTDFAIHNPGMVNKVILVDPVFPDMGRPPYPESIVRYKMAISPEDRVNGQWTDLKYPAHFPKWGDQYRVQMQYKGFQNSLVSTLFHYAPEGGVKANYQALDSLHKPVLLIWGKEDNTVPFKYSDSLRQILHTDYMPVDDAAHLPQMEKAGLVNEKIIDFLKNGTATDR